ncbi:DegT/DnrJ/EryC1/StrS aminotransferase family protein [Haloarchaeobius sp. FL176]|uniref:DegT/DnrJ/EryC1/StrS family aminotransferase n=1 Tax=Haloarchaeobius sp. FL176 TaxID=2967129 RepID=UPI002148D0DE|nr:DegT/DnrJ/EryC1/StrS family aminotransferase [Haloarchaeobius sp. FL176]
MSEPAPPTERVPIADPDIGAAEIDRVTDVLESGRLAAGDEVAAFEREFASDCGADHAVATANGTAALHAALEAIDIEPGGLVVTTPFTFVASANAIRFAGGVPVFADVDPATYTLSADTVRETIKEAPGTVEAIVAVHLYGLPVDVAGLQSIADELDIPLVMDAAQAHGATYDGERAGTLGDVSCFSFYPTKNMTTGEGGMITTDDPEIAARAERFINHGRDTGGYEHVDLGHNFRMTDLNAAIGRAQLADLREYNEARRRNAAMLNEALAETDLVTPLEPANRRHVYHQYTVRCGNRDEVRAALDDHGIDAGVYYPSPVHELEAFETFEASTPVAERVADEVLSLPVHPGLSERQVEYLGRVLREEVRIDHV